MHRRPRSATGRCGLSGARRRVSVPDARAGQDGPGADQDRYADTKQGVALRHRRPSKSSTRWESSQASTRRARLRPSFARKAAFSHETETEPNQA